MTDISRNAISSTDLDTDLDITGNGTGVPNLETGTKLNGTALTSVFVQPSDIGTTIQAYDVDTVLKDVANIFTAQQTPQSGTLTYAASQDWNVANAQVANLTLTGNVSTFNAPTGQVADTFYVLDINVGTGPYSIAAWNSAFIFPDDVAETLTTTASRHSILAFKSDGTNMRLVGALHGV